MFDILRYCGQDATLLPLIERQDILEKTLRQSENPFIEMVPSFVVNKPAIHDHIIASGGEGTVWKRTDGLYKPGRRALFAGVGAEVVSDLDATRVKEWLTAMRQPREIPAVVPPRKTEFTPREVLELLDVSGAAIRKAVKHHRLEAAGHGKKRRYPRATVEALLERKMRGDAPETFNQ
jgi:excisionase family DNA binding protein